MTEPIRVLIAARSAPARVGTVALLEHVEDVTVAGVARSPGDALAKRDSLDPHVLLLDSDLLSEVGLSFFARTAQRGSLPVILLTTHPGDPQVLAGLESGAVDFLLLPEQLARSQVASLAPRVAMLIRQVGRSDPRRERPAEASRTALPPLASGPGDLVVVAASTGGPQALRFLAGELPRSLDAAILAVLHMPGAFTSPYARRIQSGSDLSIAEVQDGETLEPGSLRIVPGGVQACVEQHAARYRVRLLPRSPSDRYAPSADPVMRSAADAAGSAAVGVILTGMGEDGSDGLGAIRRAGGLTVAESRETALIFGMPREAIRAGAVAAVLGLQDIPAALVQHCGAGPFPPRTGR